MEIVPDDQDWLEKCRVFIGWEKIPLMFLLTLVTAMFGKETVQE